MTKAHPKKFVGIQLDVVKDADVIERIYGQPSIVGYIRKLVRHDMQADGQGCENGGEVDGDQPQSLRHYHTPTVEDVLCELLDKVDDDRAGQAEIIAEYAAKLRLAGDAE